MAARSRALTIVELVVVVSTIVLMTALALPLVRDLTANSHEKEAVNLLRSLLGHARAIAVSTHRPTGLVIYEYPVSGFTEATSWVQLVRQSSIDGKLRYFRPVVGTIPQRLPLGVQVATLNASGGFRTATDSRLTKCRSVLFDSTGQMVLWIGLAPDLSLVPDDVISAWNFAPTSDSATVGASSPGLLVYDAHAYMAAISQNPFLNTNTWLRQNGDILLVNTYTGGLIR